VEGAVYFRRELLYVPRDFHVKDKWPFLDIINIKPEATCVNESDLAAEYQRFFGDEWSV
jgi:hypothetical protein